jgi:hypothetical protein
MKKFLLALLIFGGSVSGCFAQLVNAGEFNVGLDAALPLYQMKTIFNGAVGGSLKFEFKQDKNFYITVSGGYEAFLTKEKVNSVIVQSTYSYVPIKAGLKYYFIEGLYGEAQAGFALYTQHGGDLGFDYSPGIGYSFKQGFEIGIRYETWVQQPEANPYPPQQYSGPYGPFAKTTNLGQVALRIAERF